MGKINRREEVESEEGWLMLAHELPFVPMGREWKVRVMPPYRGVIARFHVMRGNAQVSASYDHFGSLGGFSEPY